MSSKRSGPVRVLGVIALLASLLAPAAHAAPAAAPMVERFVAGQHYKVLTAPVQTRDPRRIEVVEMFSYGCPHCFEFEPAMSAWRRKQPADVDVRLVPALFNPQFRTLGQAYYAAEALKVAERSHTAMFQAIHIQHRPLWLMSELASFYGQFGVKEADFTRTMDSFGVRTSLQRADALARAYQITGVPSMIVNGKYMVDGPMAGSNDAMLQVVDFLVRKERDARRALPRAATPRPSAPARAPAAAGGR